MLQRNNVAAQHSDFGHAVNRIFQPADQRSFGRAWPDSDTDLYARAMQRYLHKLREQLWATPAGRPRRSVRAASYGFVLSRDIIDGQLTLRAMSLVYTPLRSEERCVGKDCVSTCCYRG